MVARHRANRRAPDGLRPARPCAGRTSELEPIGECGLPALARALRIGTAPGQLVPPQRYGLAPLEQRSEVPGLNGIFRTHQPNTLEATNDRQAVRRCLGRHAEQPATFRSDREVTERFVSWAASVQREALSSVSGPDCQAYRAFLQAVPRTGAIRRRSSAAIRTGNRCGARRAPRARSRRS